MYYFNFLIRKKDQKQMRATDIFCLAQHTARPKLISQPSSLKASISKQCIALDTIYGFFSYFHIKPQVNLTVKVALFYLKKGFVTVIRSSQNYIDQWFENVAQFQKSASKMIANKVSLLKVERLILYSSMKKNWKDSGRKNLRQYLLGIQRARNAHHLYLRYYVSKM